MSLVSDSSHSKQDTSPKKDDLKNGDVNVDFSQLKLDNKGQYKNVLFYVVARKQIMLKMSLVFISFSL
jgi:uncharacterized protein YdgA (DUF945 family)